jgi:hypothetical protein
VVLDNVAAGRVLNIPSATFKRETFKRAAHAILPDADDATRKLIEQEIEDGVPDEPDPADATLPTGMPGTPDADGIAALEGTEAAAAAPVPTAAAAPPNAPPPPPPGAAKKTPLGRKAAA